MTLKTIWVNTDMEGKMISIPIIPSDWLEYSGIILAGGGMRTRVDLVLHRVRGVYEYATHSAYVGDGDKWEYEDGRYYDTVEGAQASYAHLKSRGMGKA